jgi:tetratricopeptide (TPR) repeat protein/predicted aspartyl protease
MSGKSNAFAALFLAVLAAAFPGAAAAKCQLAQVAELRVTMEGLAPTVPVKVNGQPARFLVDSGAFFSLVTPRAAERFKLRPQSLPMGFRVQGVVGTTAARGGQADSFDLDRAALSKVDFLIAGDAFGDLDGLLGQNVLGVLDVEYDLANGYVRIFKPQDCGKTMLAYWATGTANLSEMPIDPTTLLEPHINGRAKVNGVPIRVMFDTGAGHSLLKLGVAQRAGATIDGENARGADAVRGIGKRSTDGYILPFASFEIGAETIKNIRLRVARSDFTGADMLLGADFFLSHRVYISHSQHKLYFTYNGGPIFRLDDDDHDPPAKPDLKVAASGAAPAGADAEALRRHAAAAAARRDYAQAIADLDAAIRLDPTDAGQFFDRARARSGARGDGAAGAEARADLDQAIKLNPQFADALALRGYWRLANKELAGADGDFAAALKAAPDDPDLGLQVAQAYAGARRYDVAVVQLDAWIAAHPTSFDLGEALNARCWTRALWGRELDKALADCSLALKRGSRLAEVLDSRGMVHLRRGEFAQAISDYDDALKLQPKLVASLYGRGLAKLKAGDAAGGAADLRAAATLGPKFAEQMADLGISESTVVVAANP